MTERRWTAIAAMVSALLAAVIVHFGLQVKRTDLHDPLGYEQDALLILPFVHGTLEFGHHWTNPRLGLPGEGQRQHDYPVVDHLHFGLIRGLGMLIRDPMVTFNVYYLLTYPLVAGFATWAYRRLDLSVIASVSGGVLYAFLPFHFLRGELHYFLSAYFLVPPGIILAVRISRGESLWRPSSTAFGTLAWLAAISMAGAYYAFFTCVLIAISTLGSVLKTRTWNSACVGLAMLATLFVAGVVNHAPSAIERARIGVNRAPADRIPEEADLFGLKLTHLVLPIRDHRIASFANLHKGHNHAGRTSETENEMASLGLIGAIGLVAGIVATLFGLNRSPTSSTLGTLLVGTLLVAVIGGGGPFFNYMISPQVRAWCRISIFIGFIALWWPLMGIDRWTSAWPPFLRIAMVACLTMVGVLDQTPKWWFTPAIAEHHAHIAGFSKTDRAFFAAMESAMPPGSAVLCLPFSEYPEPRDPSRPITYRQVSGYLHTRTLRFSYGAMKHRAADIWQRSLSREEPASMLERAVLMDFDAVSLWDFAVEPERRAKLHAALGPANGRHPHEIATWYDLRPHRERMKREWGDAEFERRRNAERNAVTLEWLGTFRCHSDDHRERTAWSARGTAELHVINPTDQPVEMAISWRWKSDVKATLDVKFEGPIVNDRFVVGSEPIMKTLNWQAPPGRSKIPIRIRKNDVGEPGTPYLDLVTVDEIRVVAKDRRVLN